MTLEEIAKARRLDSNSQGIDLSVALSRALDALEEARRGEKEWRETTGAHSRMKRQEFDFHLSEAIERHARLADRNITLQAEFAALHDENEEHKDTLAMLRQENKKLKVSRDEFRLGLGGLSKSLSASLAREEELKERLLNVRTFNVADLLCWCQEDRDPNNDGHTYACSDANKVLGTTKTNGGEQPGRLCGEGYRPGEIIQLICMLEPGHSELHKRSVLKHATVMEIEG